VDTTIVPFLDDRGKPRQYLAIRSDITQRKAAEATLREQAALTELGQLAAVVAHEVRNPLAGLRASLQVLESRLPPTIREREIIGPMIQRIDELGKSVEDILLYARPQPPRFSGVNARETANEAASSARAEMVDAHPQISVGGDAAVVRADPEMLRAILLNLILNACQADPDREVEVRTSVDGPLCRIQVLDRGPGIAPDLRDRVFEPFVTTKSGGTGLGLAIVKRLVEMQGGSVDLRPRDGGGTVAEVALPVKRD
jgi:signal transduction histidine kinase